MVMYSVIYSLCKMSSAGKCERFSENERSILFGLVRSFAPVIENNKTDYSNVSAKRNAWAQIECKFNSQPDVTKVRLCRPIATK